jgi:hypothetical protein
MAYGGSTSPPDPRLSALAGTQPRHRAGQQGRQRLPPRDGPGAVPSLRVVSDPRKPPTQLDRRRQLTLLIEDGRGSQQHRLR